MNTHSANDRLQELLDRLRKIRRVEVGTFDEGDGHLCNFQDDSDTGQWVDFADIENLINEFSN
jgi:hypothetical protein